MPVSVIQVSVQFCENNPESLNMDDHYALMGDLSDGEDQQPQQQEVRLDQLLVRRQIIGKSSTNPSINHTIVIIEFIVR